MNSYEAVIGLEVHVQLATRTKIFCDCAAAPPDGISVADQRPNSQICPVCVGYPGALPSLNQEAVRLAILAGIATECTIQEESVFARKNYFYPDLPKGYQITQFEDPICLNGGLEIGDGRRIRIRRIHLEEDAGKSVHENGRSLVNLNRAGVPLIEVVSEPDLRTPEEASAYLRRLYALVTHLEICAGNLQEGNFRCDANVSVRRKGDLELGTRVEIKNVNSFRFIERAIFFEIARQTESLKSGVEIIQETRGYDSFRDVTFTMRTKEEAEDYRYFPEPDLPVLVVRSEWVDELKRGLPELPSGKLERYQKSLGLSRYDAEVLVNAPSLARFFDRGIEFGAPAKVLSNLLTGEISRLLNESAIDLRGSKLIPEALADLAKAIHEGTLSSTAGKKVLAALWEGATSVAAVIEQEGLRQVSDALALESLVDSVFQEFPKQVSELHAGKEKVMSFLVGQLMKKSQGRANPSLLQELIRKKLV